MCTIRKLAFWFVPAQLLSTAILVGCHAVVEATELKVEWSTQGTYGDLDLNDKGKPEPSLELKRSVDKPEPEKRVIRGIPPLKPTPQTEPLPKQDKIIFN